MNPNDPRLKRKILIIASSIDSVLAGIILLIYFGFLPVDLAHWGISRSLLGLVGGTWFLVAFGILVYELTKPDVTE